MRACAKDGNGKIDRKELGRLMPIFFDGEIFGTDLIKALGTAPDMVVLQCVDAAAAAQPEVARVSQPDEDDLPLRELPLHVALRHGRSEQVIAALVEAYPEAVQTLGREGDLPLHLACSLPQWDLPWEDDAIRLDQMPTQWVAVIRLLLRTHPMACGGASQTVRWVAVMPAVHLRPTYAARGLDLETLPRNSHYSTLYSAGRARDVTVYSIRV